MLGIDVRVRAGHSGMAKNAREVLADNLSRYLTAMSEAGESVNSWSRMKGLQRKQVERVMKAAHGCSVDFLDALAKAMRVEPWQLLIPGMEISHPPKLDLTPEDIRQLDEVQRSAAALVQRLTLKKEEP